MMRSQYKRRVRRARRGARQSCTRLLDRVIVNVITNLPELFMTSWCSTGDLAYLALAVILALAAARLWREGRRLRRDSWRGPGT